MTPNPLIGVAVPAYARPELLAQLVATIPATQPIFVSDNAGSLRDPPPAFEGNVLVSHSETLIPMFANWNRALGLVTDDVSHVLIPSDDDLYLPGAFTVMSSVLAKHPDADVVVFGCDLVDGSGVTRPGYVPPREESFAVGGGFSRFAYGVEARMPGVLFRREFLARIGAFDERFHLTAADSDLIQRALLLGRSVFVPQVVGLYRVWAGSLTHARQATDEWMQEIVLWTGKIAHLLEPGQRPAGMPAIDSARIEAEIVAQNLLAGVAGLIVRRDFDAAHAFIRRHRVPSQARLRTRLSLLRRRFEAWAHFRL